uniref:Uncharacterized protein n=1 Tax=Glossina brevipalpis TaxID=37001 RepID=A0A1A9WX69_9MUSC
MSATTVSYETCLLNHLQIGLLLALTKLLRIHLIKLRIDIYHADSLNAVPMPAFSLLMLNFQFMFHVLFKEYSIMNIFPQAFMKDSAELFMTFRPFDAKLQTCKNYRTLT